MERRRDKTTKNNNVSSSHLCCSITTSVSNLNPWNSHTKSKTNSCRSCKLSKTTNCPKQPPSRLLAFTTDPKRPPPQPERPPFVGDSLCSHPARIPASTQPHHLAPRCLAQNSCTITLYTNLLLFIEDLDTSSSYHRNSSTSQTVDEEPERSVASPPEHN